MKLIKAYIRTRFVDGVIRALEEAGAPGITVSRVHGVGYGYEPMLFTLAPGEMNKAPEVAKMEVVCRDEDVDDFISAIHAHAWTGCSGDGIIFVAPVERVIKIRTGEAGKDALETRGKAPQNP